MKIAALNELKDKSFVVVSPGSNELGKGKGKWIDSHDFVIRFNNYKLKGFEPDYGKKTDIFASNFDIRCRKNNEAKIVAIENVCCVFPINERKYLWAGHRDVALINKHPKIIIAPNGYIGELKKRYNDPSTGITFLWWLYKEIGILPKEQLVGFTHFVTGIKEQVHYYDKLDKRGIELLANRSKKNHNPIKEKQIFDIVTGVNND